MNQRHLSAPPMHDVVLDRTEVVWRPQSFVARCRTTSTFGRRGHRAPLHLLSCHILAWWLAGHVSCLQGVLAGKRSNFLVVLGAVDEDRFANTWFLWILATGSRWDPLPTLVGRVVQCAG